MIDPGRKREEIVLGAALHSRPHRLPAGTHAGDIEESNGGVHARQRLGPAQREVVSEMSVFGLAHTHGGYAEAEEARVVAG